MDKPGYRKTIKRCTRVIIVFSCVLPLLIVSYFGLFWLRKASAPQVFGEAIRRADIQEKMVALTFDDGPNLATTEKILDLLEEYGAKATFFVIGENAKKYSETVKRIYDSGNEIGNHSWSHQRLIYEPPVL